MLGKAPRQRDFENSERSDAGRAEVFAVARYLGEDPTDRDPFLRTKHRGEWEAKIVYLERWSNRRVGARLEGHQAAVTGGRLAER